MTLIEFIGIFTPFVSIAINALLVFFGWKINVKHTKESQKYKHLYDLIRKSTLNLESLTGNYDQKKDKNSALFNTKLSHYSKRIYKLYEFANTKHINAGEQQTEKLQKCIKNIRQAFTSDDKLFQRRFGDKARKDIAMHYIFKVSLILDDVYFHLK